MSSTCYFLLTVKKKKKGKVEGKLVGNSSLNEFRRAVNVSNFTESENPDTK